MERHCEVNGRTMIRHSGFDQVAQQHDFGIGCSRQPACIEQRLTEGFAECESDALASASHFESAKVQDIVGLG